MTALDHLWRYAAPPPGAASTLVSRWRCGGSSPSLARRRGAWSPARVASAQRRRGTPTAAAGATPRRRRSRRCCRPAACPRLLAAPVADRRLAADLDAVWRATPAGHAASRSPSGRDVVYGARADEPRRARRRSQKLLTATAALDVLGPRHRFRTAAVAGAAPADGVVAGDLWLVGGGDPLLATADYVARFRHQPQLFTDLDDAGRRRRRRRRRAGSTGRWSATSPLRHATATWPTGRARYIDQDQTGPLSALDRQRRLRARTRPPDEPTRPTSAGGRPGAQARRACSRTLLDGRGRRRRSASPAPAPAPAGAVEVAAVESPPLRDIVGEMLQRERQPDRPSSCSRSWATTRGDRRPPPTARPRRRRSLATAAAADRRASRRRRLRALAREPRHAATARRRCSLATRDRPPPSRDGSPVAGETGTLARAVPRHAADRSPAGQDGYAQPGRRRWPARRRRRPGALLVRVHRERARPGEAIAGQRRSTARSRRSAEALAGAGRRCPTSPPSARVEEG